MKKYNVLGKKVKVIVDRPLGSTHPKYNNIVYMLNYGYIPEIIAEDGEEQDAYIMGIDFPVEEFCGQVIAIINRKNDIENKWVVAPAFTIFTKEDIEKAVHFQEQYFDIEILM